mmetsp:Transcript_12138/g.17675  ORF Transcript_12138/g.17675 Transcript_12138/m.17675 type:complete len:97 (-) Transcript_12138:277-567(-)
MPGMGCELQETIILCADKYHRNTFSGTHIVSVFINLNRGKFSEGNAERSVFIVYFFSHAGIINNAAFALARMSAANVNGKTCRCCIGTERPRNHCR